ncbi:MAG: tetratricopeptide repeat protein [Chloroflexi bacterium]|nr:tetratricopeptide repeat protein [Chloroflexota bacterium]
MTLAQVTRVSEAVRQRFVGCAEALDTFYLRFAYRHMKNGVYYYGDGGLGKTWILKKILLDNQDDPTRVVTDIIDFFDTRNHSIRGLQTTIKSRLQAPEAFQSYDEILDRLDAARSKGEAMHPSAIASLESRANRLFIECCQQAIIGREVILLFDTFERVQQRYVGQWLLREFLPQVRSLIVAIAGRPAPTPARMPDNVVSYELKGLNLAETREYVHRSLPTALEEVVQSIWKHTNGAPLLIDLILDLPTPKYEQLITDLGKLKDEVRIQDSPELEQRLVAQFAHSADRVRADINRVIWVMAYFRRRFDVQMLEYITKEGASIIPLPLDYNQILEQFKRPTLSRYIKEYPEQQSHLLHDEVQRVVEKYVLPEVAQWEEIKAPLHDLIVHQYYPKAVTKAGSDLARQLKAEQLGYILDDDPDAGLEQYEVYRREIENTHDYDFEELLWGEMRDHMDSFEDSYQVCHSRGQWLRRHSLFQKAEQHYRQMATRFKEQPIATRQSLGFMLLRQGRFLEAERVFRESRSLVNSDDFKNIAMVENTLGQVARRAGKWDQALKHYNQSFRAAARVRDKPHMASVYINRGYLYALQGAYEYAKKQCEKAIELLSSLPESPSNAQRNIHAYMNLGSAYRYSGDYAQAAKQYKTSLKLARESNDLEAVCNVLQHIGINEHLWGRTFRRDLLSQTLHLGLSSLTLSPTQEALNNACEYQLQAWQDLTDSLEMALEANWRDKIDDGLHRLAKVYREVYRIQYLLPRLGEDIDVPVALEELQSKSRAHPIPFEHEYEHELLTSGRFEQLDWLEKAVRLFDLGALVADEVNDIRRALDSSTELARMFVEFGMFVEPSMKEQVPIVLRRIERLQGYDYQEELFAAMNEITRGDLDFMEQRFDSALERYVTAYADVAERTGYASFLLTDRLRDLEWRLRLLPSDEIALQWCDVLESEWQSRLPPDKWPDMLSVPEHIRTEIWARRAEREDDSGNTGEDNYE